MALRIESVSKTFGDTIAVADLSLEVEPGELVTLLGPSGCGKTTTLRMIAGFESPTSGRIILNGKDITGQPPQRRGFGMVFQNYALFPHLDLARNVAFGLEGRGLGRAEISRRVDEALALVDLEGYGSRKIQELSGGQQQRVALARALAPEPSILLLDEPLSNLDASLRERTRSELRSLLRRLGITAIFVTHDQEEAFFLADRIAVMREGRLEQVGAPEDLYHEPTSPFVASFLGRANFLKARVIEAEGEVPGSSRGGLIRCELPGGEEWLIEPGGVLDPAVPGTTVRVMVRPESLLMISGERRERVDLPATIVERHFNGPVTSYRVRYEGSDLIVVGGPESGQPGDRVVLRVRPDHYPRAFPPSRTGTDSPAINVKAGL